MFNHTLKQILAVTLVTSAALITSCSTIRVAELEASVPSKAIQEVEALQESLTSRQLDLYTPQTYRQGVAKLNKARESAKDQDGTSRAMTYAAQAKAYFEDVELGADRGGQVPSQILDARRAALVAIAGDNRELKYQLMKADNKLRSETDDFTEDINNKSFTDLQKKYLEIEVKGVQDKELRFSREVIEDAMADNARKKAPSTLKAANRSSVAAENLIMANINNPSEYENSVSEASRSAKLLHDVVGKSKEMGAGTTEDMALKLVYQDRKIGKLSSEIDDLEGSLSSATATVASTSSLLSSKSKKLEDATSEVEFQDVMNQARNEFSEDEAAVYQQGNQLIIRLKKMGFATGSAELPGSSMKLLSKINSVIEKVDAEKVMVQGHTDSTGSNSLNKKLSKQRADSVASYLATAREDLNISGQGFGETMPLASNNSKAGRALNRRVDIVVTVTR